MNRLRHFVIISIGIFSSLGEISARGLSARDISEVEVSYEQVGMEPSEVGYIALQLGQQNDGRQVVQVPVAYMNCGQTVLEDAGFVVK